MLTELQKNIQDGREDFKKETETLKNTVSEMKHTMERFKSRLDDVEDTVKQIEQRTGIQRSWGTERKKDL